VFKASIGLVVLAFITLAYGWIRGIDILLYGSIAFSALAGVALLRSTLIERRKHPELSRRNRRGRDFEDTGEQKVVLRERDRKSLAELRMELSGLKGDIHAADREELYGTTKRAPLRPFSESSDEEDGFEEVRRVPPEQGTAPPRRVRRPEPPPARSPAQTDDFRSRLSAVLGEGAEAPEPPHREGSPSRPRPQAPRPEPQQPRAEPFEDDDIGSDWIRIEDVPRISRATREGGGYARPEPPPLQPPKRRTPPGAGATRKSSPARPESATPARRRTTGAKEAPAKPAGSRGGASRGAKSPAEPGPGNEPGEPRVPRPRPKPEA
jgi:hypothetical protein